MVIKRLSSFGFHGDYLSDRTVRVFSVLLYIIITINMWVELKHGDITVCWTPANFTQDQVTYVNQVCQSEALVYPIGIASLPVTKETAENAKEDNSINFRQMRCMPLIVISQAVLFLIPWILWRSFSDNVCSLDAFIRESQRERIAVGSGENRSPALSYLSSKLVAHPVGCKVGRGYTLYLAYIFKRILYIMVCLLQMAVFCYVLEINFFQYGRKRSIWQPHGSMKAIVDYPYGIKGEAKSFNISVRTYPSEVSCQFQILGPSGPEDYTVQCSVPPADMVEMSLSLVWIWLVFLMVFSTFSFIHHLVKFLLWACPCLEGYKKNHVRCFLSHYSRYQGASDSLVMKFVNLYMKPDVYFVANMAELNGSLAAAIEIFEGLWDIFLKTGKISEPGYEAKDGDEESLNMRNRTSTNI